MISVQARCAMRAALLLLLMVTPTTLWAQSLTTLYSFDGSIGTPSALIQASDGNFYGTTIGGIYSGVNSDGTVFRITPSGTFTTLHSFDGTDGNAPFAGLIQASDGNLYGTTVEGGAYGDGTVFRITPSGTFTLLYSFDGYYGPVDGAFPEAGLIQASDGNLYGTTVEGGAYGDGTVFRITLSGTLTTIHDFDNLDGRYPEAGLIQASDGNLYGTTNSGGAYGDGTVFQITLSGTLTTLHSFDIYDGFEPQAGLIQASDGNLYGTTPYDGGFDAGTVFQITTGGAFTTLHNFNNSDGNTPLAGLIQASDGNLYGTTQLKGAYSNGTIFQITPSGTLTTLYNFDYSDGAYPGAGLIQASNGNLYGTTARGGAYGYGTVFALSQSRLSYTYRSQFGSSGIGNGQFQAADGVAVDGNGNVFVADAGYPRIQKFDHSGNYLAQFPVSGAGAFVSLDSSGYVLVRDVGGISVYDNSGNHITQFGQGFILTPTGAAFDASGNIFVVDTSNDSIDKYDNNGNYLSQFGSYGAGNGQFHTPFGIAIDGSGNLFVTDSGNNRVEKFDSNGNYLTQFGSPGSGNGQFNQPEGVAVDSAGNVFVVDHVNGRVEKFDNNGAYLTQFGSFGSGNGQLQYPVGVAVDGNGNVFVADPYNARIEVFEQAPTTTPTFAPNANHTGGTLSLAVTNPFPSLDSTTFSLDGGAFGYYTNPISINDARLHIVLAQSGDNAGNTEDLQSFYFAAAPVALSLSPDHVLTGAGSTLLTLSGAGFDAACTVNLDGTPQSTTFIDVNNLQITLPNFPTAGSHKLTVADTHGHVSNPLLLRVGKARLAVSATLSRDGSNNIVATLTFKNTGPLDATGVMLNTAILTNLTTSGSPISPTSPTLPLGVSTVTAGSSQVVTLTFPASVGASGQTVQLVLKGGFDGGAISVSSRKKLP
jgi:uncharacterized repeat protein (TIGR03803 family)